MIPLQRRKNPPKERKSPSHFFLATKTGSNFFCCCCRFAERILVSWSGLVPPLLPKLTNSLLWRLVKEKIWPPWISHKLPSITSIEEYDWHYACARLTRREQNSWSVKNTTALFFTTIFGLLQNPTLRLLLRCLKFLNVVVFGRVTCI